MVTPGDGSKIHIDASTITDNNTTASGTATKFTLVNIEAPTLQQILMLQQLIKQLYISG